jgi:hypothetical protein
VLAGGVMVVFELCRASSGVGDAEARRSGLLAWLRTCGRHGAVGRKPSLTPLSVAMVATSLWRRATCWGHHCEAS